MLFGQRVGVDGGTEWQLPGGWIENGESPQQAARREVLEETGLELLQLHFIGITNNVFSAHNHSISLCFEAECEQLRPPKPGINEQCQDWEWLQWAEVTDNLFLPLRLLRKSGYQPFQSRRWEDGLKNPICI